MNVLIGRNNAGKSSVLNALEAGLRHLSCDHAVKIWRTRNRPVDEFTHRNSALPIQIGISFHLSEADNQELRSRIVASGNGLEVASNQLRDARIASVICAIIIDGEDAVMYVQEFGLAEINADTEILNLPRNKLFSLTPDLAREFADRERTIRRIQGDIRAIERLDRSMIDYTYRETANSGKSRILRDVSSRAGGSSDLRSKIESIILSTDSIEKFNIAIGELKTSFELDVDEIVKADTSNDISVFAGNVRVIPDYVGWTLNRLSDGTMLSFKEIRDAIGRDEANQILKLKTKRGGSEALARVQSTVKSLLGVQVDAFEPESASTSRRGELEIQAEMDVDDFLVEANGAGIREALRIILDLELKAPSLAFVEEPEVHLHPGLERVLHRYLIEKSENMQLFVATHSANFLDASTRQNVYLVSRSEGKTSDVHKVASEGDLLKITEEVGLRPSTVLMFDRLVFVEGPSDEEVLTELSRKLGLDLATSSTTFVQMGGSSRFAHYAAESTLELLSRRQIKMWFVVDQDEKDDSEINSMLEKLGGKAELTFLSRREIENYLLVPEAILALLNDKMSSNADGRQPSVDEIDALIHQTAKSLLDRAIELRVSKVALKPIYAKYGGDSIAERLTAMGEAIKSRIDSLPNDESKVRLDMEKLWDSGSLKLAPGSAIIDGVLSHYGYRYRKEIDARRIAQHIDKTKIDAEISRFLKKIAEAV